MSATVDAACHELDRIAEEDRRRRELTARLRREIDKVERLERRLVDQRDGAREAATVRRLGDLLSASFHRLRPGLREIEVDDYETGDRVTVPLDPALPPPANVERLYRRARKQERSGRGAGERLCATRRRRRELVDLSARVAAASGDDLQRAAEEADRVGLARERDEAEVPKELARVDADRRRGIRTFTLRSGVLAMVGKTNRDNDFLTQRVARGNDVWMHLQGEAGSHVVLRIPKNRSASVEDLEDGAALAVHFSKRRGAGAADVMFTPRKYVRKPKGSPPGAVTVDRFKTFRHRADPERIGGAAARPRGRLSSNSAGLMGGGRPVSVTMPAATG